MSAARIAYLFSRYPVVSQTFCDSEMLALEGAGFNLDIASINPPPGPFRHERFEQFQADVFYPPPSTVLSQLKKNAEADGSWQERFGDMIARHDRDYGSEYKADIRARNALYFAELFRKRGVRHFHVHFANRATHTALFLKRWAGVPFSFTPHAQDFMIDLGNDDLLREMCREAEFVVGVSDFSVELLKKTCPDSAEKIGRIYNGIDMSVFPRAPVADDGPLRIISIGRLIEFKGFHHLIAACGQLKQSGVDFTLTIIGDGPWQEKLAALILELGLEKEIDLAGVKSQEQVKAALQNSDVFALGCIVDSKGASDILPTVITEAMGCSLPIVSTRLVGVPEMVDHEETGLLVEAGNETDLAGALARLANDRDLARTMGRAGRKRAESIFELKITSGQLIEKFRSVLPEATTDLSLAGQTWVLLDEFPVSSSRNEWERESILTEAGFATEHHGDSIQLFAASAARNFEKGRTNEVFPNWAEAIEFFPDGLVLEAEWQNCPDRVEKIQNLRSQLGTGVDTEYFFSQARRALFLARSVEKRKPKQIHAARSTMAVCAWIVHQLTGVPFSFSAEPDSPLAKSTLEKIGKDSRRIQPLDLEKPDRTRRLQLGPIQLKLPGEADLQNRESLYREFFAQFD
ncbi:MAG: glycosyltransferase [Verrucomicrobiales bacterium]|nr:glycosyltransferase [Verrucomicrobiales bacterium]